MSGGIGLCVHGHFYQPPRENAWIETIELQDSAAPFHDWNERIHFECYHPNAWARVLDPQGRVLDVVDNFEKISFNFGPTLISWLESNYPATYRHILEADRVSREEHGGHGNAIAQAYNHVILPLANRRDKVTQVRWGVEDFRHRFGRAPESVWLPETAVNEETLEVLAEEGIKFVILEPHQAEAVRPIDGGDWADVSAGTIDPRMPYRCFLKKDPKKHVDIFFYDGPISKALGFEDLLSDARRFMDRVQTAADYNSPDSQLVSLATDGETYGHHKAFGDRVLAYALNVEAPARGMKVVNYGEFLEKHPPRRAVRLKSGENGEGTAWSCPHGVRRWKEHCGCRGMGPAEWTQHWRKPLREALDWLRDRLVPFYEERGAQYLKEAWAARDAYIRVILDRSDESVARFFKEHARKELGRKEQAACLKLLEIQRHALLMYTSCGWFFTELSGMETVQILQYAARAIQLARELGGPDLEEEFLERMSRAKSNIPEFGDGREVYRRFVVPSILSLPKVLSHYAIASVFDQHENGFDLGSYRIEVLYRRKESFANLTLNLGRVKTVSKVTREENDMAFIVLRFGHYEFRCSVKPYAELKDFAQVEEKLFKDLYTQNVVELLRSIDFHFGVEYYSLRDLLVDQRKKILSVLSKESVEKVSYSYERIYDDNIGINEVYQAVNLPIPEEIRYATEYTLNKRLRQAVFKLSQEGFADQATAPVYRLVHLAQLSGTALKTEEITEFLSRQLIDRTSRLSGDLTPELLQECIDIMKLARGLRTRLHISRAQDHLFTFVRRLGEAETEAHELALETARRLAELAGAVYINPEEFARKLEEAQESRRREAAAAS